MTEPYEILEHTADIGVRARAGDLPALFERAAAGMFHLILPDAPLGPLCEEAAGLEEEVVELQAADSVDLMVLWLGELLFRFDARKRVPRQVGVVISPPLRLRARLRTERLDLARHHPQMEIKAVTYCGARVEQRDGLWIADIVFDI
jgi:SHS2 domain-containing protein